MPSLLLLSSIPVMLFLLLIVCIVFLLIYKSDFATPLYFVVIFYVCKVFDFNGLHFCNFAPFVILVKFGTNIQTQTFKPLSRALFYRFRIYYGIFWKDLTQCCPTATTHLIIV